MANYVNNSGQTRLGWRVTTQPVVTPYLTTLLDLYSGAAAAYSLRKLNSTYGGSAIRVRRSSDNTEMNIGFDSDGNLDTYSLSAFVGSGNGFVTTWYDQSGNDRNATQTTAANQPSIVSSGIVINLNNKSSISFNGSQFMSTTQNVVSAGSGGYSVFGLGRPQSTPNCLFYIGIPSGNNGIGLNNNYGTPRHYWFGNDYDSGQTFANTNSIFVASYDGAKRYTTINNVTTSANSSGKNTISPTLTIGKLANWGQNLVGYESELVIYDSNKESIRTDITNNINTYYSIYPNPTSVWNLLTAVYSADTTASPSLKTSLFAAYNGESNANDSFGSNNGTPQGGLTYGTGKIGNAFTFNGSNSYVELPNNSLNFTGDFSVSLWLYRQPLAGGMLVSNWYNGSTPYGWYIYNTNGVIKFLVGNGTSSPVCSFNSSVLTSNVWNFVTVTKTATSAKIYINGVLNTSATLSSSVVYTTTHYPMIGAAKYDTGLPNFLSQNGDKIDAVNVWQKELTASEVSELYNSGNGAQYIGDNFYKPTTNDALGTNNGTAQGGLTYGLGKVGTAFQFNGTNAAVRLPDNSLNSLTGDFSISNWVYLPHTFIGTGGSTVYMLWNVTATTWANNLKGISLRIVNNTIANFLICDGVSYVNLSFNDWSSTYLKDNSWVHITATRKGSTGSKLYLNGVLVGSNTSTMNPVYSSTFQTPNIGNLRTTNSSGTVLINNDFAFNGTKIDGLSVWSKELSADEVTELYNSGNGKQYPN